MLMHTNRIEKWSESFFFFLSWSESLVWMGRIPFIFLRKRRKFLGCMSAQSPFEKAVASATLALFPSEGCPSLSPGQTHPFCANHQGLRFASGCYHIIKLQHWQDEGSKI